MEFGGHLRAPNFRGLRVVAASHRAEVKGRGHLSLDSPVDRAGRHAIWVILSRGVEKNPGNMAGTFQAD